MPQPLDIALGLELSPERTAAIEAVRAYCSDEHSLDFWDRVTRVEDICKGWNMTPIIAAKALDIVSPYLSPAGERGHHEVIFDRDINPLIVSIGLALSGESRAPGQSPPHPPIGTIGGEIQQSKYRQANDEGERGKDEAGHR